MDATLGLCFIVALLYSILSIAKYYARLYYINTSSITRNKTEPEPDLTHPSKIETVRPAQLIRSGCPQLWLVRAGLLCGTRLFLTIVACCGQLHFLLKKFNLAKSMR